MSNNNSHIYYLMKRIFDVVGSLIALVVLLPLELIVALAIKCEDGGRSSESRHERVYDNGS